MQSSPCNDYLVTEVLTAPPQKLQLLLIEAAIRAAERARDRWQAGEDGQASEALIHAQEVVGELLAGLNREVDAELAKRVASVYLFIFRNLMEASSERSEKKLADALRVLEAERETWQQVCRQLGGLGASEGRAAAAGPPEQTSPPPPAAAQSPPLGESSPGSDPVDDSAGRGLSLEA